MPKVLMYSFVHSERPNPLGGKCYGCNYCYIHGLKGMKIRFKHIRDKYSGDFKLYRKTLLRLMSIRSDKPIFFCDCIDYMHEDNSSENIKDILWHIKNNRYNTTFLSLTKNPIRYVEFEDDIPSNMILGVTIESNRIFENISKAPNNIERFKALDKITNNDKIEHIPRFISIEPIMSFDHDIFYTWIEKVNPVFGIAIGYDNHYTKLDEPSLKDTLSLRKELIFSNFRIFDKQLRKAHWEK